MTKKEMFERVIEIVKEANVADEAVLVEKLEHEIELVSKKRTSKTKTQKENEEIVEKIFDFIKESEGEVTAAEIQAHFELTSNQKTSALVKKLVDAGRVERCKDGKKTTYKVA